MSRPVKGLVVLVAFTKELSSYSWIYTNWDQSYARQIVKSLDCLFKTRKVFELKILMVVHVGDYFFKELFIKR